MINHCFPRHEHDENTNRYYGDAPIVLDMCTLERYPQEDLLSLLIRFRQKKIAFLLKIQINVCIKVIEK